ncbi:MAG: hypothetical protein IIW54_13235 [Lachnospiraceae bacterium]|nr:hypothetical protein [Lachnospiraceae bacterium]
MDNNNMFNGQQQFQQPQQAYQPQMNGDLEEPVSFGEWMLTTLIMCIPCVNIVMMFVWAFGSGTKKSKSNYFKAALVWALIGIVFGFVMSIVFGAALANIASSMY